MRDVLYVSLLSLSLSLSAVEDVYVSLPFKLIVLTYTTFDVIVIFALYSVSDVAPTKASFFELLFLLGLEMKYFRDIFISVKFSISEVYLFENHVHTIHHEVQNFPVQ